METPAKVYQLPGFYEPFSSISHLFAALVFVYLGALLMRRGRGHPVRMVFLGIYAVSCVLLFTMSGVYHMMAGRTSHVVMQRLDHAAIFVLIAGTFTPVHGILFRGWLRWGPLIFVWTCAIVGITLKTVFFESLPEWLGLGFYLAMGWFGVLSFYFLVQRFGVQYIRPMVLGGLAYTIGSLVEFFGSARVIPGVVHAHELFHLAVIMGAFYHWQFIWRLADVTPADWELPEPEFEEELDLQAIQGCTSLAPSTKS